MILLTISLLVTFVYLITAWIANGKCPKSISDTFYIFRPGMFIGFMMFSIYVIVVLNYRLNGLDSFIWGNLGAFFLCGVPTMANFYEGKVRRMHYVSAFLGFALIIIGFGLDHSMWWLVGLAVISSTSAYKFTKSILWTEIALIINMYLGYFICLQ